MKSEDLTIIGGGASGMAAAIEASRCGGRVLLLEHKDRIGKKLLSTGNGRCNLSSRTLRASDYGGRDPAFAMNVLERFDPQETQAFFRRIGVPTIEENGRIYPRTMQAQTVLDALRFELARSGVAVKTQTGVVSAEKNGSFFTLHTNTGETIRTRTLLFACGGKAAPKTGSDGSVNPLIQSFGHTILPQMPALAPLVTDASYAKALSGLRMNVRILLLTDGEVRRSERGQLQMTDYGVSGIPAFDLSADAAAALRSGKQVRIRIDFLPQLSEAQVERELLERLNAFPDDDMLTLLNGFLPKKLLTELLKLCGIKPTAFPEQCFPDRIKNGSAGREQLPPRLILFARLCKALEQTVTGTKGFDAAQSTCGGVPTCELKETMESRIVSGLYFSGEIVDIHGRCGGYNLQWAWSSGRCAGMHAGRQTC